MHPLLAIEDKKTKRRDYEQRIRDAEHVSFTLLVLSTTEGMGQIATTTYKHLADQLVSN